MKTIKVVYTVFAAFNKEHRFSEKEVLHFRDFKGETFIGVANDSIQLEFTEEFIAGLKKEKVPFKISKMTDNIDTVFLMIDVNMGVSVIPEYFSERLAASTRIKLCDIDENLNGTDLVAVWKNNNKNEVLQEFVFYMKDYFPQKNVQ